MSQRTVAVVLKAQIDNYRDQMRQAEQHTRDVERAAMTATQRFREHNEALTAMGKGFMVAGAGAVASVALVAKATAEYGAKMAQLKSLSHATQSEMQGLSDAAMKQGQAFGQSATQVAEAEIELSKAGRSAAQIMGGDLKGALALAAAGQIDVGKATEIGVTAMTQFAAQGPSISHVADLLAAGADKALGSVDDLGQALNQGGLVASQMGVSIEETTGTLSAFAQAGLLGSDAGTSMKTMLLALQSPTQQAAGYLEKYNIHAYDTEGHFVGMAKLAGQLKAGFADASDAERDAAMSTIFGSDAIRSANVLYTEGATGIREWTKDVDAQGFAAGQAAGKMDSLQGDLTKLSAAFDTATIKAGTSADGGFRGLVQGATNLVQTFSDLPGPLQGAAVGLTAVTGVAALAGGAALVAVPKVAAFRAELTRLEITGRGAAATFGKGAGLAAGILAIGTAIASAGTRGTAGQKEMADSLNSMKSGLKDLDGAFKGDGMNQTLGLTDALSQSFGNAGWNASSLAHGLGGLTKLVGIDLASGFDKNERLLNAYGQQLSTLADTDLPKATSTFNQFLKAAGGGKNVLNELTDAMPDYRDKIVNLLGELHIQATRQNVLNAEQGKGAVGVRVLAAAQEKAKQSAEQQAEGVATLAGKARAATQDLGDLESAIEGFGSAQLDARSATSAMEQAIADATKKIANNRKGIDLHTQAGRDNDQVLRDIASATTQAAGKTLALTGRTEDARKKMVEGRAGFLKAAEAAGIVGDKAQRLADKYGLIPSKISTAVVVTGIGDASSKVHDLQVALNALHNKSVSVFVDAKSGQVAAAYSDARQSALGRAAGGAIDGPGPQGVDSVPAILAPGEHVLTTRDVAALGGQAGVYRFRAALETGGVGAFAVGGATLRTAEERVTDAREAFAEARTASARRTARDRLAKAERHLSDVQHDASAQDRADERARITSLAQGREDFVSAERRTPGRRSSDPLTYVDQLRNMSRDDNFSAARRKTMDVAANKYEASLVKLAASSEKATAKLNGLRDASAQLASSVAGAVRGSFQASSTPLTGAQDATTRDVASGWITRGGIRMQAYSTEQVAATPGKVTAAGLAAYYTAGAGQARKFADGLAALAKRGIRPALLTEIAGYGTAQGQPIVDALLSANASQLAAVNRGYTAIGSAADRAGGTVADANYAKQIAAADKNAKAIQATITADGEKLRKLIARAFGLKGYATGTDSADAGIRWVGEDGPELVGFRGGESVLNAAASQRWVRGLPGGNGAPAGQPVVVQVPPFPDTITVADASGFSATMRVVATQVVDQRHGDMAIRLMGASA